MLLKLNNVIQINDIENKMFLFKSFLKNGTRCICTNTAIGIKISYPINHLNSIKVKHTNVSINK